MSNWFLYNISFWILWDCLSIGYNSTFTNWLFNKILVLISNVLIEQGCTNFDQTLRMQSYQAYITKWYDSWRQGVDLTAQRTKTKDDKRHKVQIYENSKLLKYGKPITSYKCFFFVLGGVDDETLSRISLLSVIYAQKL